MSWSLLSNRGQRKYLTQVERASFIQTTLNANLLTRSFCLALALTGARISEVLAVTWDRIDFAEGVVILETLKRRKKGVFRAIPIPNILLECLDDFRQMIGASTDSGNRVWIFSRTTAWRIVKTEMRRAGIPHWVSKPRALRHAFGVEAVQQRIALSVLKKWLGHAKIETTAIYAEPVGAEERALAKLTWGGLSQGRPVSNNRF